MTESTSDWKTTLTVYVNGKPKTVANPDPRMTLLVYLRSVGLTGTKLGCGEGGCGACTVMISSFDKIKNGVKHFSANACLTPICSLDGCAVTTIEGIGGMRQGLHPVQQRVASLHGSQCGFCTPGIVMSLYAQLRSHPNSTANELEDAMDGNLCRCTGYRPILDAVKSLSSQKPSGCCGGSEGSGSCPCKEAELNVDGEIIVRNNTEETVSSLESLSEAYEKGGLSEPIFPPALTHYEESQLRLMPENGLFTWYQPLTISSLLDLKEQYPNARLVVGNTEVGIEQKFKAMEYPVVVNPSKVSELKVLKLEEFAGSKIVKVGAAVTINQLREFIADLRAQAIVKPYEIRGLTAIYHMLTWFASNQIRNVACVGGNIVTASPISDLNPMLLACKAVLRIISKSGVREVPIESFFLAYRTVDLKPNEILESVIIPLSSSPGFEFVVPCKQAKRREDDISICTAGFRIRLEPAETEWRIADFTAAFGGMAPRSVLTPKTREALIGRPFASETFADVYQVIKEELKLPENVPGGQSEYRMSLAVSFLFKVFLTVSSELEKAVLERDYDNPSVISAALPALQIVDPRDVSGIGSFVTSHKASTRGEQTYSMRRGGLRKAGDGTAAVTEGEDRAPVGLPVMHKSARQQVTGEAVYTDDIPLPPQALHAALVTSTRAHAKLISVDPTPAESCEGFVAFFSAKDIPATGSNHIGAIVKDEEVFATETVKHFGAVIGVVVAETHEQALYAARKVSVVYEDLPVIVSIEEAIAAGSFFPGEHQILRGDIAQEEDGSDVIVEGSAYIGGQEHFYLETNCTVAIPGEGGSQLEVFSSSQNPTKTQNFCAYVLGLPASNVVARCKRMGGGFGGKETRSVFIAITAALSAHLLQRPVSINIERDLDMSITGQRHAFKANYRAGSTRDGKLKFLDLHLISNAGFSLDLSQPVMDRALFHCDNVYFWPALRVKGTLCRTNQPSHTAFRGFGGPQGMAATEMALTHLAHALGFPNTELLREMNMYSEGQRTHFGQELVGFYVPRLWSHINTVAEVSQRRAAIETFNSQNRWKKRGICVLPTKFGINFTAKFMNQGGALVHVYTDGTVLVSHGGTEMGQGLHTKMIQIAAQSFGIPDASVHVSETATNAVANSSPTAASMSTDLYGMAVLDACEQIKQRLEPVRLQLSVASGGEVEVAWKDLIQAAFFQRIDLSAHGYYAVDGERCGYDFDKPDCTDNSERGHPFNYFTQGVACAEVEVDCLTGDSSVLRADIVMDVGKTINPALDIGQVEGAFIQGYGWSTMEELIWGDGEHKWIRPGQLFTRGPGFYKIPAFNDVPRDFRVHLSDTESRFSVHSSKAVGEPPLFLGSSVFFAIDNAVKAARTEFEKSKSSPSPFFRLQLPATSERIRMGCIDQFSEICITSSGDKSTFQPKGSW